MKPKWSAARTVNEPRMMKGDLKIWHLYSLCLMCNRHVSEDWTDDEISSALNKMAIMGDYRMTLPRIFGDNGIFLEPDAATLASLDEQTRERLDGVRTAYSNLKTAQAAEKAALDEIADALQAIADAENYCKRHFPPQTQHDLWLDQKRERERRLGIS